MDTAYRGSLTKCTLFDVAFALVQAAAKHTKDSNSDSSSSDSGSGSDSSSDDDSDSSDTEVQQQQQQAKEASKGMYFDFCTKTDLYSKQYKPI